VVNFCGFACPWEISIRRVEFSTLRILTGSPLADFELGAVSSFTQGGGLYLNFTGYRENLFVQDNWKATRA